MTNLALQTNGQSVSASLPVPVEAMRSLMVQRKDLIVKIGDTYEISRPLALELWRLLVEKVISLGGSLRESSHIQYASPEMVIVSVSVEIRIGDASVELTEIGEAYAREKGKDTTMARTAYTRAMKRLLERIAGEDFINQVILSLFDNPASERQKDFLKKLYSEGRLTEEVISSLKSEGKLPQNFHLDTALKNGLTSSQASAIISRALSK